MTGDVYKMKKARGRERDQASERLREKKVKGSDPDPVCPN